MAIRLSAGAMPVFLALGRRVFSCRHLVVVAGVVAACGGDARPASNLAASYVRDDVGRAIPLSPAPQRILSLLPSATELLVALDQASLLVARTDYDTDPRLAALPSLGPTLTPSLERIVELRPDLVITASHEVAGELPARLSSMGFRIYEGYAEDLDGLLSTVSRVSRLVGTEERGAQLGARLAAGLDSLRAAARGRTRTRVLYLLWHEPPYVPGRGTYVDQLIEIAGGENVFSDVGGWADVSFEEIVARRPDVVIVPRGEGHSLQPEWLTAAPRWRQVEAVRAGRLVVVDSDLFNRPGPRVVEAARVLAGALAGGGTP
jgi:iron complex transport system substrate-binding protein